MKIAYKPEKVKLDIKPKLFAAGQRSMVIVDEDNNVMYKLFRFIQRMTFWIQSRNRRLNRCRQVMLR